jgi:hypothetical protein
MSSNFKYKAMQALLKTGALGVFGISARLVEKIALNQQQSRKEVEIISK